MTIFHSAQRWYGGEKKNVSGLIQHWTLHATILINQTICAHWCNSDGNVMCCFLIGVEACSIEGLSYLEQKTRSKAHG